MSNTVDQNALDKANAWLNGNYDKETKAAVKKMMEEDKQDLIESFYRNLEFGTGGLRGIMGVGSNRMNKYTVGAATQGFSNYLKMNFPDVEQIKVAIACDSRNNSPYFSQITADIFSANGIKVFLFDELRPTPELSFTIRHFGCQGGIVITASHNPKEYNGYKAYWNDGAQLISPHDKNVIEEVNKITDVADIKFERNDSLIEIIGKEVDEKYLEQVKLLSLSPKAIKRQKDLKIVYTSIHGTGYKLVPASLKNFGFEQIYTVDEQVVPDGNFPTVKSPNPEEPAALELAIKKAKEVNANLVMATDPDSDRVGIAVRVDDDFKLLNGNQTAALLTYYLLKKWDENGKLTGNEFIVKTVVTSELLADIANHFKVEYFDVLTGFKWIADLIKKYEGEKTFIGGGEESYGFMIGDFVRDKDAISACSLIAETAAWARTHGKTLYELLLDIYLEFGLYLEDMTYIVKKGKTGAEEIASMMQNYRGTPPAALAGSRVVKIHDYQSSKTLDILTGEENPIELPKSNVLQFITEDHTKVSIRPSGTQPKIKFYFSVKGSLMNSKEYHGQQVMLENKIDTLKEELGIGI